MPESDSKIEASLNSYFHFFSIYIYKIGGKSDSNHLVFCVMTQTQDYDMSLQKASSMKEVVGSQDKVKIANSI